jgi:putative flippase GtrA
VTTLELPPAPPSEVPPSRSKQEMLLFGIIGVGNTLFDVALYTALRSDGHSAVTANIASTSAALVVSYLLNARLTFKRKWSVNSFLAFLAVTLFGLEVLQTSAILVLERFVDRIPISDLTWLGAYRHTAILAVPKLLATGVSFGWNFCWYSRVLFKDRSAADETVAALQ